MSGPASERGEGERGPSGPAPDPTEPPRPRGSDLAAAVMLTALPGAMTLALVVGSRGQLPLPDRGARVAGSALLAVAAALFAWTAAVLGGGLSGGVVPRAGGLVVRGPYRWVRHPVYLALVLGLVAVAIVARSAVGLFGALALFLPLQVLRARLEEELLARRYGAAWTDYAARTGLLLPGLGRRRGP